MHTLPLTELNGRSVVKWVALEMAPTDQAGEDGPVLWVHDSVPYLQLSSIDVLMEDGAAYRLLAHADDGSGYYGLNLVSIPQLDAPSSDDTGSIFRTRELKELPVGPIAVANVQADGPNAILRIELDIHSHRILCWAAEVYEENDGAFRIVEADESILLQVDGIRPRESGAKRIRSKLSAGGEASLMLNCPNRSAPHPWAIAALMRAVGLLGIAFLGLFIACIIVFRMPSGQAPQVFEGHFHFKFIEIGGGHRALFENMLGNQLARLDGAPLLFLPQGDKDRIWKMSPWALEEKGETVSVRVEATPLMFGDYAPARLIAITRVKGEAQISK